MNAQVLDSLKNSHIYMRGLEQTQLLLPLLLTNLEGIKIVMVYNIIDVSLCTAEISLKLMVKANNFFIFIFYFFTNLTLKKRSLQRRWIGRAFSLAF